MWYGDGAGGAVLIHRDASRTLHRSGGDTREVHPYYGAMSTYRLHLDNERTDHRVKGTSPAKALRELCTLAGLDLATQDGRYGRTAAGQHVMALTESWSAVRHDDHGTTRV